MNSIAKYWWVSDKNSLGLSLNSGVHGFSLSAGKLGTFGWASNFSFYYAHHLIHNLHFHAFSFLVMSLFMLGQDYKFIVESFNLFIIIIIVYQFLAIKRIFKQGWFKTICKALLIDLTYLIISTSILLLTVIISMLTF